MGGRKTGRKVITTIIFIVAIITLSYAITAYYTASEEFEAPFTKSEFFEMTTSNFFPVQRTIRPGESAEADGVIANNSSIPMYVFIVITMPAYKGQGLYTFEVGSEWQQIEAQLTGDGYFYAYRYATPLEPEESTEPLTDRFTMRNMSRKEYGEYKKISFKVKAYGCWLGEDADPEVVWTSVKNNWGL